MTKSIMEYFPLEKPRPGQTLVIEEINKAFSGGKKIVILEAPVGSGKSAIALTFARSVKDAYIITPRKSLQDQYFSDFSEYMSLMKGRNAYPCTYNANFKTYIKIAAEIRNGQSTTMLEENCANGPCRGDTETYHECTQRVGTCPYTLAIGIAQKSQVVTHNLHSFIYQTQFSDKFQPRELLVIDEVHEVEGILRELVSTSVTINVGKYHNPKKQKLKIATRVGQSFFCKSILSPKKRI